VHWCCWFGNRKGIWTVKTSASKHLGIIAFNVSAKGLSDYEVSACEDAEDKDDWSVKY